MAQSVQHVLAMTLAQIWKPAFNLAKEVANSFDWWDLYISVQELL
jgi:hypothetical protein